MFHTHAHLDLGLWHFSPWIFVLTLQHTQCKYAIMFIPTWAPHKPFRSRMKQNKAKQCYALLRNHTSLSDMRVPSEEYKWTMHFLVKTLKNSKILRCECGKMTLLQELFHFSTTQGYMLASATYPTCLRNDLEWVLC